MLTMADDEHAQESEINVSVSSQEKEQVEQRVEEEIVHEVVSPDQSWRQDESDLILNLERDEGDGSAKTDDEEGNATEHAGEMAEDGPLDDPFIDDAGVFCLDTEAEVKQKISTYETKSGTHFIVLKKEKGYTQTIEDEPTPAYSDSVRLAPHHHQPAAPSDLSEEFMCKECNVVYRSYKSLWQHNKDNHQEKFSCGYCEYSSARMYNIRQHRKRRHPNMPDPFDPNLVDMFPSAYLDDTRLEYPLGDSDEEADHIREPVNKRARFSQNTVTYSDMGDTCSSECPPVASKSLQGSSQAREVHYNTSHAAVYPVSLSNSREAVSHPGLHRQFQPQRSQAQAQSSRSDAQTVHVTNHTATMPVLPRITSVSGGSLGIHASSVNAGMLHSSTAHSHSSREQQVHNLRTTRNSQENSDPRSDMGRSVTFSGPANEAGSRQLLPSHRTVSPREDNRIASASCVSSSQRTTSTCTQLKPMHETVSGGTATTPRNAQNVQSKAPQSMSTRGGSEKKWDSQAQSSGPTCIYRPTGLGQRNSGTSSMETRHPTRINSNTEPSRSPLSSPSSNPIRGGSCKGTPSQAQESANQQGARATHSFTTVGGILDEHRQGVGLTDIQSLLPNFRVKSITERVVQPDGTRYEIQIDGEEIH